LISLLCLPAASRLTYSPLKGIPPPVLTVFGSSSLGLSASALICSRLRAPIRTIHFESFQMMRFPLLYFFESFPSRTPPFSHGKASPLFGPHSLPFFDRLPPSSRSRQAFPSRINALVRSVRIPPAPPPSAFFNFFFHSPLFFGLLSSKGPSSAPLFPLKLLPHFDLFFFFFPLDSSTWSPPWSVALPSFSSRLPLFFCSDNSPFPPPSLIRDQTGFLVPPRPLSLLSMVRSLLRGPFIPSRGRPCVS